MVGLTLCIRLSVCIIKKCKNICGAVSNVFKFLNALLLIVCSKIWKESFKYLNAGTFIKEKKIFRWILV